jgi:hypothetical protein
MRIQQSDQSQKEKYVNILRVVSDLSAEKSPDITDSFFLFYMAIVDSKWCPCVGIS